MFTRLTVDGKQPEIKNQSSQGVVAVPGPRHSRARLISSSEWRCIARQLIALVRCRGSALASQSQYMLRIRSVRSVRSVRKSSGACTRPRSIVRGTALKTIPERVQFIVDGDTSVTRRRRSIRGVESRYRDVSLVQCED